MATLYHYTLCPFSRRIRLAAGEYGYHFILREERPWERRREFLLLNTAGTVPVLEENGRTICGVYALSEYLEEKTGGESGMRRLFTGDPAARAEIRRLVEWFDGKFHKEVSALLLREKIERRFMATAAGGGSPDAGVLRAARHNIRLHLDYIGYLIERRHWLAGHELSHADLAAAAHLSCLDYLGDVPWDVNETARDWYARIKSRPSFKEILADRISGVRPAVHYADLDF